MAVMSLNEYDPAAGARTPAKRPALHSHLRGGGAAAWAKTEASASFWPIADAPAPGISGTHQLPTHPAPVDVGVVFMAIKLSISDILDLRFQQRNPPGLLVSSAAGCDK